MLQENGGLLSDWMEDFSHFKSIAAWMLTAYSNVLKTHAVDTLQDQTIKILDCIIDCSPAAYCANAQATLPSVI